VSANIIGTLTGKSWTATLDTSGKWRCEDAVILATLEAFHSSDNYSEAHGVFGRRLLLDASQRLNAAVSFAGEPEDPTP